MKKYRRKPIEAQRVGDVYECRDALGKVSRVQAHEFEALFEEVPEEAAPESESDDPVRRKRTK